MMISSTNKILTGSVSDHIQGVVSCSWVDYLQGFLFKSRPYPKLHIQGLIVQNSSDNKQKTSLPEADQKLATRYHIMPT